MPDIYSYDLLEAMSAPGCPMCRALGEAERASIASFLREGRFAPKPRRRFFAAGGFCRRHAWMLHREAREAGTGAPIADLYGNQARRDLATLDEALVALERGPRKKQRLLRRGDGCLACERARDTLDRKAGFLLEALGEEPVRAAYLESDGLCFTHLQAAAEAADVPTARFLLEDWRARLERLEQLLAEYDRKRDYRYADEPKGEEQKAWTEVIRCYVGEDLED